MINIHFKIIKHYAYHVYTIYYTVYNILYDIHKLIYFTYITK